MSTREGSNNGAVATDSGDATLLLVTLDGKPRQNNKILAGIWGSGPFRRQAISVQPT